MEKLKTAILISGRGSNMRALIDHAAQADFPACIALVISNNPEAGGLEYAAGHGIATLCIDHRGFKGRHSFERALDAALADAGIELICLAGFMRLLSAEFVNKWRDKILNIHPSLLPSFKGLNVHERVIDAGVRFSGCTVHFVRPEMDDGPIIIQAAVPVRGDDDADSLAARVLKAEHRIYPQALALVASGRVRLSGQTAKIEGAHWPVDALFNPQWEDGA